MVDCIRSVYDGTQLDVKCGEDLITSSRTGQLQAMVQCKPLSLDDITDEGNKHAPTIGKMLIPGLLFADGLALGDFTIQGLKREMTVVAHYNKWNLKCNLQKSKIMTVKKRWHMDGGGSGGGGRKW